MTNKQQIFYMVDSKGNRLEASPWAGEFEKYGISNIEVLKNAMGLRERVLIVGNCRVNFEVKEYGI